VTLSLELTHQPIASIRDYIDAGEGDVRVQVMLYADHAASWHWQRCCWGEIVEGSMGMDGAVVGLIGSPFGGKVSDMWRGVAAGVELLAEDLFRPVRS
jgi:hypothetical protein